VGTIMMVMVLLFPKGVVGEIQQLKARFKSNAVPTRG
jgi:ABC-type branched-subunit amino acid transport system permease subunit